MSKLNDSSQIKLLRSDSNRKIGAVYLAIAEKTKTREASKSAADFLSKARKDLQELQAKNELGKNDEHKLSLINQNLEKITKTGI